MRRNERPGDFDLRALYEALDGQRKARGLSWAQVAREINRPNERERYGRLSVSTITGLCTRTVAEADGVLQMLRWLDRAPESFLPDYAADAAYALPRAKPSQVLRFDTRSLHAALDAKRAARRITWRTVAEEIGVTAANLAHLAKGGRTSFPSVMRITRWLEQPAARFTRPAHR